MKHAITALENSLEEARTQEAGCRSGGNGKQGRHYQTVAWDCLEAIELLKLTLAVRKCAARAAATRQPVNQATSEPR